MDLFKTFTGTLSQFKMTKQFVALTFLCVFFAQRKKNRRKQDFKIGENAIRACGMRFVF